MLFYSRYTYDDDIAIVKIDKCDNGPLNKHSIQLSTYPIPEILQSTGNFN